MPWGGREGDKVQSSPVQSNPVREVNECTISNANKADTTGAQREIERKTSDLEKGRKKSYDRRQSVEDIGRGGKEG